MLRELEIHDFAIIESLSCRLQPGLNVLTGETGAGKSIIVDALGLLLGARADATSVRAGAERAVVQGVFGPGEVSDLVSPVLAAYGVPEDPEILMGREVHAEGRSTARINGRVVPARALAEVGELLVDTHSQGESALLLREAEHIGLLDRFAGLAADREALGERVARYREVREAVRSLCEDRDQRARRAALLAFEVEEIERARLAPDEEERLVADRTRLVNAERLAQLADRAYGALRDQGDGADGAVDRLGQASEALHGLVRIDPALASVLETVTAAADSLAEAAAALRDYRDRLEFQPSRLEEVEERLALIGDLKRKHGVDIAAVLAFAERASAELEGLAGGEQRLAELQGESQSLLAEIGVMALRLSEARQKAALRLGEEVESELASLGMAGSRFQVAVSQRDSEDGAPVGDRRLAFGPHGVDAVSFLVAANRGEPPRPLVAVSSGGETARIMLGLKSVLQAADRVPVLVFDEIDAGIGGRIGAVVGRRLWSLTARHQVLCVTHLPQVAVFGDVHWHVRKEVVDGRTVTVLTRLEAADRVNEIAQMLGTVSATGRQSALQLLQETEAWKAERRRAAGAGREAPDPRLP